MDQETPRLQADGACIGIPVAPGYAAPPPLTTSAAPGSAAPPPLTTSGGAAPRPPTSVSGSSTIGQQQQYQYIISAAWDRAISVTFCTLTILLLMYALLPLFRASSFKVEQVSVFVSNSSYYNATTAHWSIRLNVETGNNRFKYPDLVVLLRCNASRDWSTAVVTSSNRDEKNTTSLIATVNTLLPQRSSFQGLVLEVDVMLRVDFVDYKIQAVCRNMAVRFSSSANQGFMEEGPRLCRSHTSL